MTDIHVQTVYRHTYDNANCQLKVFHISKFFEYTVCIRNYHTFVTLLNSGPFNLINM